MSSSKYLKLDTYKRELLEIYKHAIKSVKPNSIIDKSIKFDNNHLLVEAENNYRFNVQNKNIHVIGAGKCVLGMASALANRLGASKISFSHGCLSVPSNFKRSFEQDQHIQSLLRSIGTNVYFGSSTNIASDESVIATKKILQTISDACEFDKTQNRLPFFIVILSGGGSACLTQPKYIDLERKLNLTQYLVEKGADIVELNKVRSYFSSVKGGKLAKFILKASPDAQILALILSDVIKDPIEYIASGPTVLNSSIDYKQQMLDVLAKYSYPFIEEFLFSYSGHDNLDSFKQTGSSITNCIIGNNLLALQALTEKAKSFGYTVLNLGNELQGETEKIVAKMIEFGDKTCSSNNCDKLLVIGGGEATIKKKLGEKWGIGGRLQESAIDYMTLKTTRSSAHQCLDLFLAGSSDGQDGPTDVAACFASYYEWNSNNVKTFNLDELKVAKNSHNSYNFWTKSKPNWLIKTGLTGTNVMDLYMYSVIKT